MNVRDCEVEEQVAIEVSLDARSPHVLSLTAKLSEASGRDARERFEPVSYEWSFGDGTRQETNGSVVEHSYEGQPQKTRVSYFLIDVKIKDRRGRVVSGARAVATQVHPQVVSNPRAPSLRHRRPRLRLACSIQGE